MGVPVNPVETRMAGRTFSSFHVDVGLGDVIIHPGESFECRDWLGFAGIERSSVLALSCEQHLPRNFTPIPFRAARRTPEVKDLVDMLLLFECGELKAPASAAAEQLTFERQEYS